MRVGPKYPSERQIARRLGITQQAVHKHLRAAVRKYPALETVLFPKGGVTSQMVRFAA